MDAILLKELENDHQRLEIEVKCHEQMMLDTRTIKDAELRKIFEESNARTAQLLPMKIELCKIKVQLYKERKAKFKWPWQK